MAYLSDTTTTDGWNRTQDLLPPEGQLVFTMDSSGRVQKLRRQGRLWFVPDGSMYVYYVPIAWRADVTR